MILDVEHPGHTQPQPDWPKESSPRGGGSRTRDIFSLRLPHGLSKILTGTHNRRGLLGRRLRYGTTQIICAGGQTAELEAILQDAIDSLSISFSQLEKLAGKCTSMSVAIPPASLYTHHMYPQIAGSKRSGGRKNLPSIAVSERSGLPFEVERWSEVRSRLNGAPWYDATRHVLTISGATDASSQAWGGLIRGPSVAFSVFKTAADLPAAWHNAHINVKETFALHEVLKLATTTHPGCLKGSTAVVDLDNKAMHDAFKKGRSRNTLTHNLITKLFWLQVKEDFTLELRLVCLEANWSGDRLARPERTKHVRLSQSAFDRLWETWGGVIWT